jgi:hypothetical protein
MSGLNSSGPSHGANKRFSLQELMLIAPLAALPFGAVEWIGLWSAASFAFMGVLATLGQGLAAMLCFCTAMALVSSKAPILGLLVGIIMALVPLLVQVAIKNCHRTAPRS